MRTSQILQMDNATGVHGFCPRITRIDANFSLPAKACTKKAKDNYCSTRRAGSGKRLFTVNFQLSIFNCLLIFACFAVFFQSCGNAKKPGLSDKELLALEVPERKTPESTNPADFLVDTLIPHGVKYSEARAVDPKNPPVTLPFFKHDALEENPFQVEDYWKRAEIITLTHPSMITKNDTSANFFSYHKFTLTDKCIFFQCISSGLFCYDYDGRLVASIYEAENPSGAFHTYNTEGFINIYAFSYRDGRCVFVIKEGGHSFLHFYDLSTGDTFHKIFLKDLNVSPFHDLFVNLMDSLHWSIANFDPLSKEENFLTTFGIQGDTLCRFTNYLPKPVVNRSYTMPDPALGYQFFDQYTIRQPYNDTIFRISSPNRLTPAWVLDFGDKYCDIQTGLLGDKSDKLILYQWKEGKKGIFCIHTLNYDCPRNRNNESVTFFYSFYDKTARKLYRLPMTSFPDEQLISNPLPDGLPFFASAMTLQDDFLYVRYGKNGLRRIMEHPQFANLPETQQENVKMRFEALNDTELLMMVLR